MKKVSALSAIVLLLFMALFPGCRSNSGEKPPEAVKGVLDLSGWNVDSNAIQLSGEWEFYRGKLVQARPYADSSGTKVFANVPHRWDKKPPYDSVATYLLHVKLGRPYQTLALEIRQAVSVYRIYRRHTTCVAGRQIHFGQTIFSGRMQTRRGVFSYAGR